MKKVRSTYPIKSSPEAWVTHDDATVVLVLERATHSAFASNTGPPAGRGAYAV